jgi:hypothetical protein
MVEVSDIYALISEIYIHFQDGTVIDSKTDDSNDVDNIKVFTSNLPTDIKRSWKQQMK